MSLCRGHKSPTVMVVVACERWMEQSLSIPQSCVERVVSSRPQPPDLGRAVALQSGSEKLGQHPLRPHSFGAHGETCSGPEALHCPLPSSHSSQEWWPATNGDQSKAQLSRQLNLDQVNSPRGEPPLEVNHQPTTRAKSNYADSIHHYYLVLVVLRIHWNSKVIEATAIF